MEKAQSHPSLLPYAVAVGGITFALFASSLFYGFINWDDHTNFLNNPYYRGLGLSQLRWMWTTFYTGVYIPLTWMSLGLDYLLFDMNPMGYHFTNNVIHSLNAVLCCVVVEHVLARWVMPETTHLSRRYLIAAFAALLFSIHPLRVESVVWLTERRDVLCGFFFLGTLYFYVRRLDTDPRTRARRFYFWAMCGSYACSLLAKATAPLLPLVFLVVEIAIRPRGWTFFSGVVEKIPLLILSGLAAAVALYGQYINHALVPAAVMAISHRAFLVFHNFAFYMSQALWPFALSPYYEFPLVSHFSAGPYLLRGLIGASLTAGLFITQKRYPVLWLAWSSYLLLLLPVSGIFQVGHQLAADHYSYIPMLPWSFAAAVWLARAAASQKHEWKQWVLASNLLIVLLACLTLKQVQVWKDYESFLRGILHRDPGSAFGNNNYGAHLASQGRVKEAVPYFEAALARKPEYELAKINLERARRLMKKTGH